MYVWIWRHLPGGLPGKILGSLALAAVVAVLLFLFVFPWAETRLPFNDVTIDKTTSSPAPTPTGSTP